MNKEQATPPTPEQATQEIFEALRLTERPERTLVEMYLTAVFNEIRTDQIKQDSERALKIINETFNPEA